ncbi:MAG: hypothetical protein ACLTGI_05400 [Hoylesella buccalis]
MNCHVVTLSGKVNLKLTLPLSSDSKAGKKKAVSLKFSRTLIREAGCWG